MLFYCVREALDSALIRTKSMTRNTKERTESKTEISVKGSIQKVEAEFDTLNASDISLKNA